MLIADWINGAARRLPTWPLYVIALMPPGWLLFQGATGGLGADPAKVLEHDMGLLGLQVYIATLMISPLRRYARINLIKFRRALGLITFFYIFLHLLVWLVLDVQLLDQIWEDIMRRPYITIGMLAFVLLVPLALTSNDWSIRKMGAAGWQKLHRLAYVAVALGAIHYVMLTKTWAITPLIYLAVVFGLLALRLRRRMPRRAQVRES